MDQNVPGVLRAFPAIRAVLFVWSTSAFHWFCTQSMTRWTLEGEGRKITAAHLEEFPQRSVDNAWAVFCPSVTTTAVATTSLSRRLLGQAAAAPWIVLNMTTYKNQSLVEWGSSRLDFFTMIHVATAEKGASLVSLNTPPSVMHQLYGEYEQPPPSIYWLDAAYLGRWPEFARSYFASTQEEDGWWERVIEHTEVNLHVLPASFDPDTQAPPATFWTK